MFQVETRTLPERRLAALHHTGPYEGTGACFEELDRLATEHDLWPQVQGMVEVHYDDPATAPAAQLRAHAGLVDAGGLVVPEGLEAVALAGGEHAVLTYKGPYASIKVAYDYLFGKWLPGSGREPADAPCYEVYLNDPVEVAEEDLLTEICLPLKAA